LDEDVYLNDKVKALSNALLLKPREVLQVFKRQSISVNELTEDGENLSDNASADIR